MSDETSAAIAERVVNELAGGGTKYSYWAALRERERRDRIALVDAGRAAASSDLDAIKREAAEKAWNGAAEAVRNSNRVLADFRVVTTEDLWVARDRYLAAHHPAPVPEPPHVMVNGWRVTWNEAHTMFQAQNGPQWEEHESATALLTRIGMGWLQVDSFAVRVLALREGRGDGHAE